MNEYDKEHIFQAIYNKEKKQDPPMNHEEIRAFLADTFALSLSQCRKIIAEYLFQTKTNA